jgi:nicotinate-nucleotide--dimethylbenzimidazole phosphoribosyltransferase
MNRSNKEEKILFEKLESVTSTVGELDLKLMDESQKKLDNLAKPIGSLGRLEDLSKQIVGITKNIKPVFKNKYIFTMAADHGIVKEGVSAYPMEVTYQMVLNFLNGGAAINVLARHVGAKVIVVDMGVASNFEKNPNLIEKKVDFGTKNMLKGPAMTISQAIQSILNGVEVVDDFSKSGNEIIGTGDMGIGNTTSSSAIVSVICNLDPEEVTGYGTGLDEKGLCNKIEVIRKAIKNNDPNPEDGIDILSKIGGFEIGGIAGLIIGAAAKRIPVIIDGFISGAGALIAEKVCPNTRHFMIASHQSVEKGHKAMLEKLSLKPLFNFDMRLGEGTGAAFGISVAEASVKILNEMATFGEAGVSEKNI